MKAAIYHEFGKKVNLTDVPDPIPVANSVILKVHSTGLCRSDWYGWQGFDKDIVLPHIPGHELVGEIVETGSQIKKWKIGDRVTVPFVGGCGECPECLTGNQQVCDFQFQPGFTSWGSFAEFTKIEYANQNLVLLPDHLESIEAACLGCRFITAFRGLVHQAEIKPGQQVAVYGCGGVGLSAIMIAKAYGAETIAIDLSQQSLELARAIGADHRINASEVDDVPQAVKDLTHGGVHISIDAIGKPEASINSIYSLKKKGKHIQIGLLQGTHTQVPIPMDLIVAHELEIKGSHGMQAHRYDEIFSLLDKKDIHLKSLIGDVVNLQGGIDKLMTMDSNPPSGITIIHQFY